MVEALARLPRGNGRPTIAFDLEAVNLGRRRTTCYLQVRDLVEAQTYLVDILTLQDKAFLTTSEDGTTLKDILEDPGIIMLIFDGRQDADTLYWKHGVQVRGVLDLQTMTMLLREHASIYRTSYISTMNQYAGLTSKELRQWNLFKGYPFNGDYTVFKERPLPYRLKLYSIGDVLYLDRLYTNIAKRLTVRGLLLAHEWSRKQVEATWQTTWTSSRQYVDTGFNRCWEEQINRTMKPAGPPLAAVPATDDDTDEEDV